MISTDFAPNETKQDALLALKILTQPWRWGKGRANARLKRKLKRLFFGSRASLFLFLSGRSALYYYLKSLNLPNEAEILIQGFTCEAVVLPIIALKYKPIYVDINEEDFSMNLADLKKKTTEKSAVLVLQHTFGITPTHRKEILSFAKERNIIVIEDVAHGFNPSLFKKRTSSTLLLSFGRSKVFSGVFGGVIVTHKAQETKVLKSIETTVPAPYPTFCIKIILYKIFAHVIKSTYDIGFGKVLHRISQQLSLLIPEITKGEKRGQYNYGLSKSMPNCSALFILEQLKRSQDLMKRKIHIMAQYQTELPHTYLRTDALIRYPFVTEKRDRIIYQAKKNNVYLGSWYDQVVGPKSLELKKVHYIHGTCPVAEMMATKTLNLPTNISKEEARKVIDLVLGELETTNV
ncbi:DegT/DnrJ/EryC1/StrS family aminotransferase [Candidatus Woesebacteria bacterium]|nr:DegT/DnrJ/EryC1/StrS family aminotransferase [Candidatus Woesebacteria bacterium]